MRIIIFITFILSAISSYAQVDITNQSLTDSTRNLLYIGVNNVIKISHTDPGHSYQLAAVKGDAKLVRTGNDQYTVRVAGKRDYELVVLTKEGKSLLYKKYTAVELPGLRAMVSGLHDSAIYKSQLTDDPVLHLIQPGFYKLDTKILSFQAVFIKNEIGIATENPGNLFSTALNNAIKGAVPGDKIWFNNIRILATGGRGGYVPPLMVTIK